MLAGILYILLLLGFIYMCVYYEIMTQKLVAKLRSECEMKAGEIRWLDMKLREQNLQIYQLELDLELRISSGGPP